MLQKEKKRIPNNFKGLVPRLIDFDWRVDIKMQRNIGGTDTKSNTSGQQTCILQFEVRNINRNIFFNKIFCNEKEPILINLSLLLNYFNSN